VLKGFGFGVTSGVVTTLGLIVGLHSGTHSKLAVVGGIVVLAVADALSDAMGVHVSEEAEGEHSHKEVWEATVFTFLAKFVFTLSFIPLVLVLEAQSAILASVAWGLFLITLLSLATARGMGQNPVKAAAEHVLLTIAVVVLAHYAGEMIYEFFSGP